MLWRRRALHVKETAFLQDLGSMAGDGGGQMSDVVEVSAHNTPSGASLSALCSQSGNRLLLAYFTLELDVAQPISYILAIAISTRYPDA